MSRVVCWYSCGAASAVATKLALEIYKGRDVVVARCIVKEEHPDNDRFARDCAQWFGVPIVELSNEKYLASVYEVIRQRAYISGVHGAPCTLHLKKQVREEFQRPDDTHIFGYTLDPKDLERWDRFLDANNIDAKAPLIDARLTHSNALAIVQNAGLRLPEMYYLGFHHNNCIGCVKSSGMGYWNKVREHFPLEFRRMAATSRAMGVRMIETTNKKRIFLDELKPGTGRYDDEPEVQCGAFCEAAQKAYLK